MGWANRITLMRIGAVLPILALIHFPSVWTCWAAMFLFLAAAITDFLDGYIARREKQVTNFGKFLDPLADKLLICSILIEMVGLRWVPAWVVIIVIMRELAVTGLRAVAADKGIVIAADWYGKWKTVMQIVALVPLLIHFPLLGIPFHLLGSIFLYVALLLTIFSGANYFYVFYRDWRSNLSETPS
ncbi:MAG: CDP-diacylglycerol--glycerol-3-phosphate 3-phosphatidyltransferase [Mailhella sp.]|nr:CDP-diacylglycerol--glycerol-3-phosphate 3-phosphatidyltransferase [Mailhella sp.]